MENHKKLSIAVVLLAIVCSLAFTQSQPRPPVEPSFDDWLRRNYPDIARRSDAAAKIVRQEVQQEFRNSQEYRNYELELRRYRELVNNQPDLPAYHEETTRQQPRIIIPQIPQQPSANNQRTITPPSQQSTNTVQRKVDSKFHGKWEVRSQELWGMDIGMPNSAGYIISETRLITYENGVVAQISEGIYSEGNSLIDLSGNSITMQINGNNATIKFWLTVHCVKVSKFSWE